MYGQASASMRHVSAAGIANTSAPKTSATAVVACVSRAPATSAFQPACSAAEARTSASARRRAAPPPRATSSAKRRGGDVAAGDRHADALAGGVDLAREQRGERAGAARLRDGLRALEQEPHGRDDLLVGDRHDLVHELLDDRERELAGDRQLLAVGDRARDLDPDALAGRQRALEVVARLRLDADDPRVRAERRGRGGAAGHQPAAADRDDQHVERPGVLEQLERDRALAGHHALVVVRVHRDQPALGDQRREQRLAVGAVAVEEHDLGAVAAGRGQLARRRVLGHQDHGRRLEQPRGERDGLRVVAGGHGRDATRALVGGSARRPCCTRRGT